ncbi:MAG TPA: hypothetical protein VGM08_03680, partial [Candidatus Saccharimonadales bacterium]
GFAHHLLLPLIAILVVAGIGTYILSRSHAATTPTSYYSSSCTKTTYGAPNSKFQPCALYAQELLNGIQHQKKANVLKLTAYGGSTFKYGNIYYLLMNGLYGKYTAAAVTAVTGNKNGQLTNGTTGGWQTLCKQAKQVGLASGGPAANGTLKFGTAAGETATQTDAGVFTNACGSLVATKPASGTGSSTSGGGAAGSGSGTGSNPAPSKNISCNYQDDTWSGDAATVGYSVAKVSAADGNPASFSVKLNANKGTTEVVGYPSEQCLMYAALPSSLTSSFSDTLPASSSGLDYEYAYDIWLTTASAAQANNWDNDLELMIWNYVNGQVPAGAVKATLSDGSKVWVDGNNTTGTVSVVLPKNETSGTVNISSIVSQLKSLGYVSTSYNGILDVEYGIEAPYGGSQTFTVKSLSVAD